MEWLPPDRALNAVDETCRRLRRGGDTLTQNGSFNLFVAEFSRDRQSCFEGAPDEQQAFGVNRLNRLIGAEGPFTGDFFGTALELGPRVGLTPRGDVLVTGQYQPAAQFGAIKLQSVGGQDGLLAVLKGH